MRNNTLAENILNYRKQKNYTQEELAQKLNVSFQAVSKWEKGQSYPDITLLPALAAVFDTDLNALMGCVYDKKRVSLYEEIYKQSDYYWGVQPSPLCYRVMEALPPVRPLKLLDIGCGEGKDAVFFAQNGYEVSAFDISAAGVEKTKALAEKRRVQVHVFQANLMDFRLETAFDVIFSSGVLQYILPERRAALMENYIGSTNEGGIHAMNVFVDKPFIAPPPEKEPIFFPWRSGELFLSYTSWEILSCKEMIFDCNSSGIAHQHCMDEIIAQKRL